MTELSGRIAAQPARWGAARAMFCSILHYLLASAPIHGHPTGSPALKLHPLLIVAVLSAVGTSIVVAQEPIYRCGNEYTNNPSAARDKNCKLIEGGNVSVVQGSRARSASAARGSGAAAASAAPATAAARVDPSEQRARDADARAVLEAELRRSEAKLAELRAEYKDGQPDKIGIEARNHQKYLDRVAELKAAIARTEADIAGIRRELSRFGAPPAGGDAR